MTLSQKDRLIRIATPLSDETFAVESFKGTEAISQLYQFDLQLISQRNDITFDQLAGQNVTVGIRSGTAERVFNGMIIAFTPEEIGDEQRYSRYHAVMAPTLWAHTECYDCRIFQDKNARQIIEEILSGASLGDDVALPKIQCDMTQLPQNLVKREYCVQYNESNYDFISRLCEEEGFFFYFTHENGRHVLVFADNSKKLDSFADKKKGGAVKYQKTTGAVLEDEVIIDLRQRKKMISGKYSARDFNFTLPEPTMSVFQNTPQRDFAIKGEIYEYPGGYKKTEGQGNHLAAIRMQAHDVKVFEIKGHSNCRGFTPGCKFKLTEFALDAMNNKEYVLTSVYHTAQQEIAAGASRGDQYTNRFYCIPAEVPYRPGRRTRKPVIAGSQTAIVTGPKAEEIHTNQYGQVKVRFHWDRRAAGSRNGNMSCWIRVSHSWAGGKWGAIHIPRVGQEVIVNFLDGDPDRPIITGCVYNSHNMPPYDLPGNATRSTIKSNTSKGGRQSNEIRFEDMQGKEEFFTRAAKDQNEVVQNNMTTTVKANQSIEVKDNRTVTVTAGNETVTIQSGSREVTVQADEKHTNAADFRHQVAGNYTLKISGNLTIDAGGIVKINGAELIFNG